MRISDWSSDVCSSDLATGGQAWSLSGPAGRMERRDNEFRTSVERLPADHGRDSLPTAGPSGPAAGLHLAGLRPGAPLSRTAPLPGLLAKEPGRPAAPGSGREHPHHQAHRDALPGRTTDAALEPIDRQSTSL